MEIRRGTPDDCAAAMSLVIEFVGESLCEYGVVVDPAKIQQTFDAVWKTSFVAVVEGKVVGVLAGQIVTDICSNKLVYEEILWYTSKRHRKYGVQLYRHVEQWCRENNIGRIIMSLVHNSKTDKLFMLYAKLGFQPQETKCVKEL